MNKVPKPKKYSASLAPTSAYRKDYKLRYRHVSIDSNSLETVLKWLAKIEERKFDKRFPWHSAHIFKQSDPVLSFSFKY